jgi:hypothetical protein
MVESSYIGTISLKYGLIIIGACLIIASIIIMTFQPSLPQEDYTIYNTDWSDAIILFCLGSVLILINLLYISQIRTVSVSLNRLAIFNGKDYINYTWTEVESLRPIPFLIPTSYWLKIKESKSIIIFASNGIQGKYASFEFQGFSLIRDFSQMGKTIRQVKKAYDI